MMRRRHVLLAAGLATVLTVGLGVSEAQAFSPVEPLSNGWHGNAKLGAHQIAGNSDSRQVLAAADLDYRNDRFENRLSVEMLRVTSTIGVREIDGDGAVVVDGDGEPQFRELTTRTADRRAVALHPQWFWRDNAYIFFIFDYEQNEPEGLESAARRIGGFGHRLWNSKNDLLAAEIGAGSRRLRIIGATPSMEPIGYIGLKFTRDVSERTRFSFELDSDFGSEERFSQAKLGVRFKLTDNVALRLKYITRTVRDRKNARRPRTSDRDSETAIYLEFDLF